MAISSTIVDPRTEGDLVSDTFIAASHELNIITATTTPKMFEGSLFYKTYELKDETGPLTLVDEKFHKKYAGRNNLLQLTKMHSDILEIGFNAGHSALAILHHNPSCKLTSVDIGSHPYVQPASDFLKRRFGSRFNFIQSNSMVALPRLKVMQPNLKFDLIHIDGGHDIDTFKADLFNSFGLVKGPGSYILIDDTDMGLMPPIERAINKGLIQQETPEWWKPYKHMLVKVLKTTA